MNSSFIDTDPRFGERSLHPSAISLSPTAIAWAAHHSQTLPPSADAWSCYVQLLAMLGTQSWLNDRLLQPALRWDMDAEDWQSLNDETLPTTPLNASPVPQLWVGQTLVNLLPLNCVEDGEVDVPRSLIGGDSAPSQAAPHFHLLVEVLEELDQVQIRGFLAHEALVEAIATAGLTPHNDHYTVPTQWFSLDPDRFLLQVEIPAPVLVTVDRLTPQRLLEAFSRPAINAAVWLNHELDQVANYLSWQLLPSFDYSPALRSLRSSEVKLDGIVADLTRYQSVTIPTGATTSAYDVQLDDHDVRLYVMIWELPTAGDTSDWMLLTILSSQSDSLLPLGISLQVYDTQTLLAETTLQESSNTFLYTQIVGAQQEAFLVTVRSPNGLTLTIPPITFIP